MTVFGVQHVATTLSDFDPSVTLDKAMKFFIFHNFVLYKNNAKVGNISIVSKYSWKYFLF